MSTVTITNNRGVSHLCTPSTVQKTGFQTKEERIHQFLGGKRFRMTGPLQWEKVTMGETVVHARAQWVYNQSFEGKVLLGGTLFIFKKQDFPDEESLEWWAVDLLNNRKHAALQQEFCVFYLKKYLLSNYLNQERLKEMVWKYGSDDAKQIVDKCTTD